MVLDELLNFRKNLQVLNLLKANGGESRFVGGCVRDALAGLEIKDIDIATTLLPDQVEKTFHEYKTLDVGKSFGTVIVIIDHYPYEITTLRKDVETDGRRAVVEYTTKWEEDALRRDFTINAMSYCPDDKKLYDYFGGVEDLKLGRIRFVGDAKIRVQEDFLRILRFFRFYTYFGKHSSIDKSSLAACVEYSDKIKILSGERKYKEFYKILLHPNRLDTLELMFKENILSSLFECDLNIKVLTSLRTIESTAKLYEYTMTPLLLIFIIMVFHSIEVKHVVRLFRLSSKDSKYLENLHAIIENKSDTIYKLAYKYSTILLDAMLYLSPQKFMEYYAILEKGVPTFPITGADLIEKFQLHPGPDVGKLMKIAEDFWCQSAFKADKDEILKYLIDVMHRKKET